MTFKIVLIVAILIVFESVFGLQSCADVDHVLQHANTERQGMLFLPVDTKHDLTIEFSVPIKRIDPHCLVPISQHGTTYHFYVTSDCPHTLKANLTVVFYGMMYENNATAAIEAIYTAGELYCNSKCNNHVYIDETGVGFQSGTFHIKSAWTLSNWKFEVGFAKNNPTSFTIVQTQSDSSVTCSNIKGVKPYSHNSNLAAGTIYFKYYLTYIDAEGVPEISYFNLYDDTSSNICNIKPQCQ